MIDVAIAAFGGVLAGWYVRPMLERRPTYIPEANFGSRNSKLPPPKWEDMNPANGKHDPAYQILNLTERVQRLEIERALPDPSENK